MLEEQRTTQAITKTHLVDLENLLGNEFQQNELLRKQHKDDIQRKLATISQFQREIVANKNELLRKDQIISQEQFQIREIIRENDALRADSMNIREEMKQNYHSYEVEIANLKKTINEAQNHILRLDNECDNLQKDHTEEIKRINHLWDEERRENEKHIERVESDNHDLR